MILSRELTLWATGGLRVVCLERLLYTPSTRPVGNIRCTWDSRRLCKTAYKQEWLSVQNNLITIKVSVPLDISECVAPAMVKTTHRMFCMYCEG